MKALQCDYLLVVLFVSTISEVYCSWRQFSQIGGWKLYGVPQANGTRGPVDCVWSCYVMTDCRAASFISEYECMTHDGELTKIVKGNDDDVLWLAATEGNELFVRGETDESFTYVEAALACGELGAILMSLSDLNNVLTAQHVSCRCGWLNDGTQWTIDGPFCNSPTVQPIQCFNSRSNAWCIVE